MNDWWGIKPSYFMLHWLVLSVLWAGILAGLQYVGPLFAGAEQGPLFHVQALIPEMQRSLFIAIGPWGGNMVAWSVLTLGGVACSGACVADWREHVLPDQFTLGGGICVLIAALLVWGWEHALLGAAVGYALLWGLQAVLRRKQKGQEQIGCGDVKFMIPLGAMAGPLGLLPLMGLACVLVIPLFKIRNARFVPFGPALALAALMTLGLGLRWPMV